MGKQGYISTIGKLSNEIHALPTLNPKSSGCLPLGVYRGYEETTTTNLFLCAVRLCGGGVLGFRDYRPKTLKKTV